MHSRPTVSRTLRLTISLLLAGAMLAACERAEPSERAAATVPDSAAAPTGASAGTRASGTTARPVRDSTHAPTLADTLDPGATVRAYLAALSAHSAMRDTTLWEASRGSDDGFRTFRDTTIAAFAVGAPGRIEGAAGSRYVELALTVDLATRTSPVRLHGTATLRRAVVDGATVLQRQWRIVRIRWGAPATPALDSDSSHQ